jgi:hypothetical protein
MTVPSRAVLTLKACAFVVLCLGLAGCGSGGGLFGGGKKAAEGQEETEPKEKRAITRQQQEDTERTSILELFNNSDNPNTTVEVNKYIWQASLEVLNFLPIESVDPFTGVIVTGYGRPPGGGRAYRATVYVQDPALDARSLKIALQGQGGGAVAPETVRAIEDAILTRARQLRVRDSKL